MRELIFAARQLWKSPGFALVAVATLALGIGVNTAIFSVVEAVILRPLPYPEPERLLFFHEVQPDEPFGSVSPANLADYRAARTLTGVAHVGDTAMNLTGNGSPERVYGTRVTWNFFDVTGVQPMLGRPIRPADDRYGASHVVVLGNEFWRARFKADPRAIGQIVHFDGQPYEVIGVMPAGFVSPEQFTMDDRLEYYVPACFTPEQLRDRGLHQDEAIARLKPGVRLDQAVAEFAGISARLAKAYPNQMAKYRVALEPAREKLAEGSCASLLVLLGAVVVILLIACANVANLLLARSVGQRREIAIRIALGARRTRILREMFWQTGLLAAAGCAVGLVAATWIDSLLIRLEPGSMPRLASATLNFPVLVFTIVVCGGAVLLFGAAPAWAASAADPQLALHSSGTRHSAGSVLLRWRALLMAGEIALSLVLLIGAGLMLKSFMLLRGVSLGFAPERVLTMNITIPEGEAPRSTNVDRSSRNGAGETPASNPGIDPAALRRLQFFETLTQRVEAIPGVESAAFGRFPLRGHWSSSFERREHPLVNPDVDTGMQLDAQMCSVTYFRTLEIPVVAGRAFTNGDRVGSEPVVMVNRAFEAAYYAGGSALGHSIRRTGGKDWRRIVGVVGDAHFYGQDRQTDPAAFLPAAQVDSYPMAISDFAVKSNLPLTALLPAVRNAVWSLNPDQPITRVRTLGEQVTRSQGTRRFQMTLLLLFGGLALALALVGVYGVVAYSVEQRTGEIGIRMALGAPTAGILGMVLRQVLLLAVGGVGVGLAVAWLASRALASLLYAVKPVDATTYAAVSLLLLAAALGAASIPASRAARADPIDALRHE